MANCKFEKYKEFVSYDGGNTWFPTSFDRKGDIIEYDSADCNIIYRWVKTDETICIEDAPTPTTSGDYLTFISQDDITVTFTPSNSNVLSYSKDSGQTWTQGNTIAMDAGDEVMLKGEMTPNTSGIGKFSSTGQFTAQGNPMSLLFGDNFSEQTSLSGKDYAFRNLFSGCTYLESIENLVLPATTLAERCYGYMFGYCTSLTSIPSGFLPSTTLATRCYYQMFKGCSSLTTVPSDLLQATALAQGCYTSMFNGCSSLTTVPSNLLPATTLAQSCYASMFNGCTSLSSLPSDLLLATTMAEGCYSGMFSGCTSLTTAPNLLATTLADRCYEMMFMHCSSLTTAPTLPATTLTSECYLQMFFECTNLNYIKCLATDISASYCTTNWVGGVAANGTFVKASSMSGWSTNDNGIPNGWSVQDAS